MSAERDRGDPLDGAGLPKPPEFREQYCPVCGVYLGLTESPPGLPPGMVHHRFRCHSSRCRGRERWVDLAGGVVRPNRREESP